ncbi:endonuclease/exonuclease/phosphatase family protein [Turneriella parva]|uniref:Endonuclease/exonuclease/phosphatase n=1 Tax=Turneriella parva (strain ATCC BAA-1111 / DSM 21527 / NCTC 11395 / H) TaxID=869212 RepID=I4B3U4_TURPD|nr:endonuclease/exonuclease/phosphatase family protein [Turneriella parva]AFM11951.1 Endonuclease/exonuclease/phosphatase [Turneriella parva DSM 21527]
MKIATWNCGGALRKKVEILQTLNADVYIIQECERPGDSYSDSAYAEFCANSLWVGDLHYKGLGIFAKPGISLSRKDWSDHGLKHFLPARINDSFDLLAMWAHKANSPTFGYIGQLWKYLQFHIDKMENIILAGDLNSNVRWDKWDRWWNHSDVVRELDEANIVSLYHLTRKIDQGKEPEPTFFLQRNHDKSYHIDYVFASRRIAERLNKLDIGDKDLWLQHSDHLPLCVEID